MRRQEHQSLLYVNSQHRQSRQDRLARRQMVRAHSSSSGCFYSRNQTAYLSATFQEEALQDWLDSISFQLKALSFGRTHPLKVVGVRAARADLRFCFFFSSLGKTQLCSNQVLVSHSLVKSGMA